MDDIRPTLGASSMVEQAAVNRLIRVQFSGSQPFGDRSSPTSTVVHGEQFSCSRLRCYARSTSSTVVRSGGKSTTQVASVSNE